MLYACTWYRILSPGTVPARPQLTVRMACGLQFNNLKPAEPPCLLRRKTSLARTKGATFGTVQATMQTSPHHCTTYISVSHARSLQAGDDSLDLALRVQMVRGRHRRDVHVSRRHLRMQAEAELASQPVPPKVGVSAGCLGVLGMTRFIMRPEMPCLSLRATRERPASR